MAQVTRRTIRSPWSTGIPEYVWRHQANIAAHNVTRQLPTRRATQVLRTGTKSALGQARSWGDVHWMAVLPPKAEVDLRSSYGVEVPISNIQVVNAPKRRYEPSVRCSTWPSLGCRRAADHRSKFFRRQRREQDWRSRGRSRGTRGASVRANDPAAAVRRQKLASGPATSCSSCLFPRAHYFVELKRETLGAFAVSARDVIAQLANESFGAGHVRFRNIVGAVVDMPMRSHFSAAEAFFCDHFARLTCLPEISNVGPPD